MYQKIKHLRWVKDELIVAYIGVVFHFHIMFDNFYTRLYLKEILNNPI